MKRPLHDAIILTDPGSVSASCLEMTVLFGIKVVISGVVDSSGTVIKVVSASGA